MCAIYTIWYTTHIFWICMNSNQRYSFFTACVCMRPIPTQDIGGLTKQEKDKNGLRLQLVVVSLAVRTTCSRSIRVITFLTF